MTEETKQRFVTNKSGVVWAWESMPKDAKGNLPSDFMECDKDGKPLSISGPADEEPKKAPAADKPSKKVK